MFADICNENHTKYTQQIFYRPNSKYPMHTIQLISGTFHSIIIISSSHHFDLLLPFLILLPDQISIVHEGALLHLLESLPILLRHQVRRHGSQRSEWHVRSIWSLWNTSHWSPCSSRTSTRQPTRSRWQHCCFQSWGLEIRVRELSERQWFGCCRASTLWT